MSYAIVFDHELANRAVEDAYRIIEAWLRDQGAKVSTAQPPAKIEAVHGRSLQPMGWKKDAKKTMTFELAPRTSGVAIRVTIAPPFLNVSDVMSREDVARANWNELLAELWVRFGETEAYREAIARPPVDWNVTLQKGKGMSIAGAVVLVGVALLLLAWPQAPVAVASGVGAVGAIFLVYGVMNVQSARHRLRAQHSMSGTPEPRTKS